jgi:hypothetical protein
MKPTTSSPARRICLILGLLLTLGYAFLQTTAPKPAILSRTVTAEGNGQVVLLSAPYVLDKVYKSMLGPRSNQPRIRLSETAVAADTLWLTGLHAEVVDARTHQSLSPELFCHSNLTFNPETTSPARHNASFKPARHMDWRIFTLVPGMMAVDLPAGFGVPVRGDTLVDHFTMSLNQNPGQPARQVQMRSRVNFTQNGDGMKPVFRRALYIYQQHQNTPVATAPPSPHAQAHQGETCGESCSNNQKSATASTFAALFKTEAGNIHPGATCCVENASAEGVVAQFGAENTTHWMVPPGSHRYRSEVTLQMALPESTTAHYINGHLHPYGKSLDLIDMESGKTVFHITSEDYPDRLGVRKMSAISSPAGIPLVKGRRYELVADYTNPTQQPIDAMAILYVYLLEPGTDARLAQK